MNKNIILSGYEDKMRQMLAIKRDMNSSSIDIIHRTLYPTKSNKFTTVTVESIELETIINSTLAKPFTVNVGLNNIIVDSDTIQFIIDTTGSDPDSKISFSTFEIPNHSKVINYFESILTKNEQYLKPDEYCSHRNLNVKGDSCVECTTCGETFNLLDLDRIKDLDNAIDMIRDAVNTIKVFDIALTNTDIYNYTNIIKELDSLPDKLKQVIKDFCNN